MAVVYKKVEDYATVCCLNQRVLFVGQNHFHCNKL